MTATRASRGVSSKTTPLVLAAGAAVLAPTLIRPQASGPVLCPLRRITGEWCPTCGMTRAVGWMAHLDFEQAVRLHPLAPLVVVEAVVAAVVWLVLRRHPNGPNLTSRWVAIGRIALVVNAVIFVAVWLIRLQMGSFDDLG